MCICSTFTRWKISNIAQRLASRAQVVREPTFLVAFRRLPSKNREFSTVVRRFSYSVWKGRRPASSGRVAFRARVVQCALVSHALGGFALKRFLCFRISSNTFRFDERKCFYFGGRNVKRVSRRSFNFFHVSLGKKRKQREKRKKHFPLPRAYRVLKISKQHENAARPRQSFPASLEGNSRGAKYSTNIRVNGAFWPNEYRPEEVSPTPLCSREEASATKVVWKQSPLDAHPLRGHLPSTRYTCVYDYAPAPFTPRSCTLSSPLVHTSGISGCRASMRVTWTRMHVRNPRIDCANVARRLLLRGQPCILAYATF